MYTHILKNNTKTHICVPKQLKRQIYNNTFLDPLGSLLPSSPCLHYPHGVLVSPLLFFIVLLLFITICNKLYKLLINSFTTYFLSTLHLPHFLGSPFSSTGGLSQILKDALFLAVVIFSSLLSFGRHLPLPSPRHLPLIFQRLHSCLQITPSVVSLPNVPLCGPNTGLNYFSREFPQSHLIPYALYPV